MNSAPNIVLFLTDDHAPWTLPAYGNRSGLHVPHFERLAAEGALFQNAFTPCPVCSPARACLMTGRTPSQVGIHDWLEESDSAIASRDWLSGEPTLPERLHANGYHTILSGKWHLGRSHQIPRGFVRCFGLPGGQGMHNGLSTYHQDGVPITLGGNKSSNITDRALAMLEAAPRSKPFFLNVGYIATHSPYSAAAHDPAMTRIAETLLLDDLPAYVPHPWAKNEDLEPGTEKKSAAVRERQIGYYAAVLELDSNIGRIISHLESTGKLNDTIIIYISDHGCSLGQHGFFGKGNSTRPLNMYDVSLRVPLLVRGPGILAGAEIENPVDHYDLFLAICEWAGASPANTQDFAGHSLCPLTRGELVADWQMERFGEYGDLRMIRTPDFKLVQRFPNGPDDLFDLATDPDETKNLAHSSDHIGIKDHLAKRLGDWYAHHESPDCSGLGVAILPMHNLRDEAWRDGRRENRI